MAKRIATITTGTTLTLLGAAMMVLPGPGILTVAAGLAVLARELPWARRLLDRLRGWIPQMRVQGTQANPA
jgi:hypothetical protein